MLANLFALTLLGTGAHGAAPAPLAPTPIAQDQDPEESSDRQEIGMSFYVPKHLSPESLIKYVQETMEFERVEGSRRKIFEPMNGAITVQGRPTERDGYLRRLVELDEQLGAIGDATRNDRDRQGRVTKTVRVSTISPTSAVEMVRALGLAVASRAVDETATIVLSGDQKDVETCLQVIAEADIPLPQITLHCDIISATDGESSQSSGLSQDVANALASLNQGKTFQRTGSVLVRGSVGSRSQMSIESVLDGATDDESVMLGLNARPSGFDEDTGTLNLERFQVQILTTTRTKVAVEKADGSVHQSMGQDRESQSIEASLALKADETTIVGSLGGEPVYIALRFTVE